MSKRRKMLKFGWDDERGHLKTRRLFRVFAGPVATSRGGLRLNRNPKRPTTPSFAHRLNFVTIALGAAPARARCRALTRDAGARRRACFGGRLPGARAFPSRRHRS